MLSKIITVNNPNGIHLRVAAKVVQASHEHEAKIVFYNNGKKANAESILELLFLEATKQSQITVTAEGREAEQALEKIELLLIDGAGI